MHRFPGLEVNMFGESVIPLTMHFLYFFQDIECFKMVLLNPVCCQICASMQECQNQLSKWISLDCKCDVKECKT